MYLVLEKKEKVKKKRNFRNSCEDENEMYLICSTQLCLWFLWITILTNEFFSDRTTEHEENSYGFSLNKIIKWKVKFRNKANKLK